MTWEFVKCDGDGPIVRRIAVPGGWLYATFYDGLSAAPVFVPEPSKVSATYDEAGKHRDELGEAYARGFRDGRESHKVTADQSDDLAYPEWCRGQQAGYMQATANEKAMRDELILSLQNVLELIDDNEKSYAQSHINGIIKTLRSDNT